jgi:hypothetical protein
MVLTTNSRSSMLELIYLQLSSIPCLILLRLTTLLAKLQFAHSSICSNTLSIILNNSHERLDEFVGKPHTRLLCLLLSGYGRFHSHSASPALSQAAHDTHLTTLDIDTTGVNIGIKHTDIKLMHMIDLNLTCAVINKP